MFPPAGNFGEPPNAAVAIVAALDGARGVASPVSLRPAAELAVTVGPLGVECHNSCKDGKCIHEGEKKKEKKTYYEYRPPFPRYMLGRNLIRTIEG